MCGGGYIFVFTNHGTKVVFVRACIDFDVKNAVVCKD